MSTSGDANALVNSSAASHGAPPHAPTHTDHFQVTLIISKAGNLSIPTGSLHEFPLRRILSTLGAARLLIKLLPVWERVALSQYSVHSPCY